MISFVRSARVNSGDGQSSLTISNFQVDGSDRAIVLSVYTQHAANDVTSVVFNGSENAVLIGTVSSGSLETIALYLLINPTATTADIVITRSSSTNGFSITAGLYNGVYQDSTPDNSGTNSTASGTSIGVTLTTVADNCWLVGAIRNNQGVFTSFTNAVERNSPTTSPTLIDTDGPESPAGSYGMSGAWSGSGRGICVVVSLAPAPEVTYAISGQVTLNGNPVDGATLILIQESDYTVVDTTMSDSSGLYAFSDLDSEETYHVAVEYEADSVKYNAKSLWAVSPVEVE